ncbi:efflux RND transporter periplasmic adaptor subunit [Vibrio sp. JC009]|uniref:efflux RND transporter periplasmic adaptor subunit n=1 Tax=Vibrio sp. JC009 TaxID=2912314 RepID=UPI0023B12FEF|nr:efflux RND transporter periplasmic adaptor subunit [Vibrio sp. JC009]WED24343.1 efflux RND transporter periplasmic adaptor subunit [Vibrio sp. JC009]
MRKHIFKLAVLPMALAMLQGCQDEAVVFEKEPLQVSAYEVTKPVENQYRNFKGTVSPADLTPMSFRIEGELDAILVKTGQKVKKGEMLAKLDDSKLRQQMADAQAQYELAVRQLGRGMDLVRKKMISQSEFDELTANKRIAEVSYETAKNNLEYTRLVAPFDGYVAEVPKESFESVTPGETVVNVYRDDVVRVRIGVSDIVLASLNPDIGSRDIKIPTKFSGDERQFTLKYYEHSTEPSSGANAFEFWLEMPQVEPAILPGATANLDIDLLEAGLTLTQGYEIPVTALDAGNQKGEFFIWKYVDGNVQKQNVEVIQVKSNGVIVSKGVRKGDLLVNSSLKKLRDNAAVKLVGGEE